MPGGSERIAELLRARIGGAAPAASASSSPAEGARGALGIAATLVVDEAGPAPSRTASACIRSTSSADTFSLRSRAKARARRASPAASHACAASSSSSWKPAMDVDSAEARSAMTRGSSVPVMSATRARRYVVPGARPRRFSISSSCSRTPVSSPRDSLDSRFQSEVSERGPRAGAPRADSAASMAEKRRWWVGERFARSWIQAMTSARVGPASLGSRARVGRRSRRESTSARAPPRSTRRRVRSPGRLATSAVARKTCASSATAASVAARWRAWSTAPAFARPRSRPRATTSSQLPW